MLTISQPFRVILFLKAEGFLNEKYPGGIERHKELLEAEGYEVAKKGKRYFVPDYGKYLIRKA